MRSGRINLILLPTIVILLVSALSSNVFAVPSLVIQKTWGGSGSDSYNAVAVDSSGNIYAAGITNSFGPCSPSWNALVLVKYSPTGTLLWQKIWTNGSAAFSVNGVAVDSSGNVYVAGGVLKSACSGGYWTGILLKFDSAGNIKWQEAFKGPNDLAFAGIAIDPSNDIYIAGTTYTFGAGGSDILIIKLNTSGVVQWQKTWGGSSTEAGYGLATDSGGNVYVTGYSLSFGSTAVLLKIDPTGSSVLFQKLISSIGLTQVELDTVGNIYAAGTKFTNNTDALLLKFDSTSGFQWARTWGGSNGTDATTALAVDQLGNPAIAGYTDSYGAGGSCFSNPYPHICYDLFYAKLNNTGGLLSQFVYGGPGQDQPNGMAFDGSGNAVIAGSVSEAPPYTLGSGNKTLGSTSPFISTTGNSTLGNAGYTNQTLTGTTSTPSGSESYAGSNDGLLLKYGTLTSSTPISPLGILLAVLIATPMAALYKRKRR